MTQLDTVDAPIDSASADTAPRLGRKRDHTRDPEILEATLDVLAEVGYDGMTVDLVAARAHAGKATLYRRWPSKAEMVLEAVACMKQGDLDLNNLPDTGSLRGDLLGLVRPHVVQDGERKLKIMAGVASLMSKSPDLAASFHSAMSEPRATATRMLLERAEQRGEIAPGSDLDTIALVSASMSTYRVFVRRLPVDRAFLLSVIDGVVLPAVGIRPQSTTD